MHKVWWSGHFGKYCDNTVDPAFGESFDEGFDENVGQQPVASTYLFNIWADNP